MARPVMVSQVVQRRRAVCSEREDQTRVPIVQRATYGSGLGARGFSDHTFAIVLVVVRGSRRLLNDIWVLDCAY